MEEGPIIEFLNQPIFMLIGGIVFWFVLKWSKAINKDKNVKFWENQKDEIIVTCVAGLLFWVFTGEILAGWDWAFNNEEPTEFHCFFYLVVGPAVERIYSLKNKK